MAATAPARPSSQPKLDLSGRRLGRYEVLTQLASGGMATVYIGRAVGVAGFERLVAIKLLHPHFAHEEEFVSMFLDEARLAARIRHPNVVSVVDVSDTEGDGFFIVMDYIEGNHLGAVLQEAYKLGEFVSEGVVVAAVLDALAGLGAAHGLKDEWGMDLNLVHRDVSPHNVIVGVDGIARLTDFGVAKAEVRLSSTRDGQFKGKLAYMAPEHASTGYADQRSDLFAMGVILWECLAGTRLFRAENNAATLHRILKDPIPLASSQRPEAKPYDALLQKALERDPERRFQTADEFQRAIEEVVAKRGPAAMASRRQVAEAVRRYAAEKLEAERERLRMAIDVAGHADVREAPKPRARGASSEASLPPPSSEGAAAEPSASGMIAKSRSPEPASAKSDATPAADPVPARDAAPARRGVPIWAVFALLVAGIGGAYLASRSRPAPPVASPSPAAAPAPPAVSAAPTPPTERAGGASHAPVAEPLPLAEALDPATATARPDAGTLAVPTHRRAPRGVDRAPTAPAATEPGPSAPTPPTAPPTPADDDLLINPYRR